jgi:hypothetical protein
MSFVEALVKQARLKDLDNNPTAKVVYVESPQHAGEVKVGMYTVRFVAKDPKGGKLYLAGDTLGEVLTDPFLTSNYPVAMASFTNPIKTEETHSQNLGSKLYDAVMEARDDERRMYRSGKLNDQPYYTQTSLGAAYDHFMQNEKYAGRANENLYEEDIKENQESTIDSAIAMNQSLVGLLSSMGDFDINDICK